MHQFTNNAATTLTADIDSSQTTITVSNASNFPAAPTPTDPFYITIEKVDRTYNEICLVTARTGNDFTVTRGQDNTIGRTFLTNDVVQLRVVAANLNNFVQSEQIVGVGDMQKSTYDTNDNGIVDGAETVNDGAGNSKTAAQVASHLDNASIHTDHTAVSVQAGTGLTGGGDITATRTLNVSFAGDGVANTAARSDHLHAGVYLPVAGKAADSDLLDNLDSTYFLNRVNHVGTDEISDVNGLQPALDAKEDGLGNPTVDGYVLTSLINGTRSWQAGGTVDVANVGTGEGTIYRDTVGDTVNLKTLKQGNGVVITNNANEIQIDATGAGGGEANTTSDGGTNGIGLTLPKSGVNLPFKNIVGTTSVVTVTESVVDKDVQINFIQGNVDHNALTNYVANQHVDHTTVNMTAGAGLTGGGNISASRTFDVQFAGDGAASTVARSDHLHPGVYEPVDATLLRQADVDDTPVNGATTVPVSSNWAFDHNAASNPHGTSAADVGAEPDLGNPTTDGYVLSSTIAGVRSWVAAGAGGASNLPDLGDVDSAAQTAGFVLASSGANYLGRALISSDIPDLSATYLTPGAAAGIYTPLTRNLTAGAGLSGGGDLSADRSFSVDYGTTPGTACQGNDSRLADARTPIAHAASHADGGSDELDVSDLASGAATLNQVPLADGVGGVTWGNQSGGGGDLTDAVFPTYAGFDGYVDNTGSSPSVDFLTGNKQKVTNAVVGSIDLTAPTTGTYLLKIPDSGSVTSIFGLGGSTKWIGPIPSWAAGKTAMVACDWDANSFEWTLCGSIEE